MNIDTTSLIRDMGMNAGLLCFLAALYSIVLSGLRHPDLSIRKARQRWLPWITGLMFGLTGILTMLVPLRLAEGVIVDARLVMAGLAGAYLSPLGAVLCAVVLGAYRLSLGGIGSGPAMVGIVLTTGIGWLWQHYRPYFLGSASEPGPTGPGWSGSASAWRRAACWRYRLCRQRSLGPSQRARGWL